MQIVPVIDLKGGLVVRARHGDRASYKPIETPLSPSSEPMDVIAGLLRLHAFKALYVADLDAIEGRGDDTSVIETLAQKHPSLAIWLDNGCADIGAAERQMAGLPGISLVIGSESQRDCELLRRFRDHSRVILSLDFRGDGFLGPPELLQQPDLWPERVILMTLARVGSDAGPDLERLAEIAAKQSASRFFLAGGVRHRADLAAVRASGAAGVLVASALHDGRISAADLAEFDF